MVQFFKMLTKLHFGVAIAEDLSRNKRLTKANRTLGFRRRNLYSSSQDIKEATYKGLVRPALDYASSVWNLQCDVLQVELECKQKCATRFVTGNYTMKHGV